ncbi:MAG: hypothetical protein KY455_04850 [Euryarchaeota archaeon]|nr:hypothetical protein [Euryarchaeota archaeon]
MRLRTIVAVIIIAGSIPFAAATGQVRTEDVEGRMILFDLTKYDPDLAAVAGLATGQTSWFDGVVVLDKASQGWVYAVPKGTGDPSGKNLFPTGETYAFTDDNGASWSVREWYYLEPKEVQYMLGNHLATERLTVKVHVWTVHTGAVTTDSGSGQDYNFVVVVDVTKLATEVDGFTSDSGDPEGPREGQIDLWFLREDPEKRCLPCQAPRI